MPNEGLPLRPFGIPDLVWPPGVCAACYEPQWSDALLDWEFVEAVAGPCSAGCGAKDRSSGQEWG